MRRTPVAHIVFPRCSSVRPVSEFAWEAVHAIASTRDLDVSVLIPVPAAWTRRAQNTVRELRGVTGFSEDLERVLEQLEPAPTLIPYLPVPSRSIESAALAISAHLLRGPRASRPAVIQGSFLDQGGYAATVAAEVMGAKAIVVAHGSDVRAARGQLSGEYGRKRRALRALQHATKVLAVSHEMAGDIALLGRQADVVRFTSRASLFPRMPFPHGQPEVLFVGSIGPAKGVDVLFEAFSRTAFADAKLRLIGPVVPGFDVEAEAARHGISARVRIDGEVMQKDLAASYAAATCLVLPSKSEGLPCVIVEALLVGRPVVASDVGGIKEIVVPRVGALVPSGDVHALARAIDEVLERSRRGEFDPRELHEHALPMAWEENGPRLADLTRALV